MLSDSTGYILVSDSLVKVVKVKAVQSDGSEMVSVPLNSTFKQGLFIAMSDDKTFHFYRWEDIAGEQLKKIKAE
jgi:3-phytase